MPGRKLELQFKILPTLQHAHGVRFFHDGIADAGSVGHESALIIYAYRFDCGDDR